jgi:hypothetical protein
MNIFDEVKILRASILGAQRQLEVATLRLMQIEDSLEGAIRAINKRTGGNNVSNSQQGHAGNPDLLAMERTQAGQEGLEGDRADTSSAGCGAVQQVADFFHRLEAHSQSGQQNPFIPRVSYPAVDG